MRKIIMLGGVHGVGKSYLCEKIKEKRLCEVYTASHLIRQINYGYSDQNKRVDSINNNQNILLDAISKHIPDNTKIILDGHFCLINSINIIEDIPYDTFCKMELAAIILLTENPSLICQRLIARDDTIYSQDFIEEFQNRELAYASNLAKNLDIKFLVCNIHEMIEVENFITNI